MELLVLKSSGCAFVIANEILIKQFNSHYYAYEVDENETIIKPNLVFKIDEFENPPFNMHKIASGQLMFRLKTF